MMPTLLGANMPHVPSQNFASDPTFAELSRQLAMSDSMRRISRGSAGQRPQNNMRVVKPSSASNSPQAMMARRRTMMNDNNLARRRQQVLDQAVMQQMQDYTSYSAPVEDPIKRSNRPVSWHPSSHIQQPHMHIPMPQQDFSQYIVPAPMAYHQPDIYSGYHNLPPTPAVYSGQTSPISSMSPLCLPYAASSQPQTMPTYISQEAWNSTPQFDTNSYATNCNSGEMEPFPSFTNQIPFNWGDSLAAHGFNVCTAPPTPDEFQVAQQPEPTVTPEESIPYQPLEESEEEEGEILVGMGLYDPPKTEMDPGLDNYRTTTSQLLGTTYRRGQGWKLEEAWEPPATDDEDGEGDEEEEEAEEGKEEEKDKATESAAAEQNWI
ncbi:uncharacterized protein GGS22DRAFT_163317 [Annulohypoxylon maeteangense]|uniref:uncharacterized protein n=1 Tax=Annulohypoxylon maeteangense TaxID=1927788 RepID=UPI0020082C3F|nr:uncharacterized protein GGS22DRAFT_163317 [Annulohypoxylon maeteangense]KAI0885281.1 hypothetical protein GGS22DRAFT_163317 [Annulohypoxylon maeteangense]